MSRFEKIAFIESFWKMFNIEDRLNHCSNKHLDQLLKSINNQVKGYKYVNAALHVKFMPVFLN